jgi:uncharacterized protein YjiS (DUF1127 family)
MRTLFTDVHIDQARALARNDANRTNLPWTPEPGQFVYDDDRVLPHTSPFQENVFFILDLRHFLRYAESVDELQQRMFWLPTWHDCLSLLHDMGVSRSDIASTLTDRNAIQQGTELDCLYELLALHLNPAL